MAQAPAVDGVAQVRRHAEQRLARHLDPERADRAAADAVTDRGLPRHPASVAGAPGAKAPFELDAVDEVVRPERPDRAERRHVDERTGGGEEFHRQQRADRVATGASPEPRGFGSVVRPPRHRADHRARTVLGQQAVAGLGQGGDHVRADLRVLVQQEHGVRAAARRRVDDGVERRGDADIGLGRQQSHAGRLELHAIHRTEAAVVEGEDRMQASGVTPDDVVDLVAARVEQGQADGQHLAHPRLAAQDQAAAGLRPEPITESHARGEARAIEARCRARSTLSEGRILEQVLVGPRLRAPVLLGRPHVRAELGRRVPGPARVVEHGAGERDRVRPALGQDRLGLAGSVISPTAMVASPVSALIRSA